MTVRRSRPQNPSNDRPTPNRVGRPSEPTIPTFEPTPLLHTRAQAARLLNVSIATLIRLEKQGTLKAVKLNKQCGLNGATFYKRDDLIALASGR